MNGNKSPSSLKNNQPIITESPPATFNSNFRQPFTYDEEIYRKDDKIDNEIIVQRYRDLRRQQKEFLMKINLSTRLKKEIFGLTDARDVKRPDENQKLVTLVDPFKGRLIIKERAWLQIEKEKEAERLRQQKQYYAAYCQQQQQKERQKERQMQEQKRAKEEKMQKQEENIDKTEKQSQKMSMENIRNIFSFLPGLGTKQPDDKQLNKNAKQEIQQEVVQRKSKKDNTKQTVVKERKLIRVQQENTDKNQLAANQYNIKIQGYTSPAPNTLKPPKPKVYQSPPAQAINRNSKKYEVLSNNIENRTSSRQQFLNVRNGGRNEDRFKQQLSEISDIPKKQVIQEFSNQSYDGDNRIDEEGSQQILRSNIRLNKPGLTPSSKYRQ